MAKYNQFNQKLNRLFADRTHWLRTNVKKIQGRPPRPTNSKINRAINHLQDIASEILIREVSNKEFSKTVLDKKKWYTKNKGRGWDEKKKEFDQWFKKSNINYKNYVYVFWAGKKCRYVGRSIAGRTRPQTHFEKLLINGVTKINVLFASQRTQIPKLECLSIHLFKPPRKYNKYKPSFSKWDKPCQICETEKLIRQEIKSIFKLR